MRYTFKKIPFETLDKEEFNSFPDKTVLTTPSWIRFIEEDSKAQPYILRITEDGKLVGYFTALRRKQFKLPIIASPFPGWSTQYMGFDLLDSSLKCKILPELVDYVFKNEKCWFFQVNDRGFDHDEILALAKKNKYTVHFAESLELGIDGDDAFLYKNMKTDCRNFIKQFERRGATIEQAEPNDEFAEEYYEQLLDVFAKQNLVPTYTVDKVKCLLKHLSASDSVLCLRVKDPEGKSIATSIFPGFNKRMFFWGGASLRPYQQYRPNEYMIYAAMKYWRDRGCTEFDMVGNRPYKKKFGSWETTFPCVEVAKYPIIITMKNIAAKLYYFSGKVLWKLHLKR